MSEQEGRNRFTELFEFVDSLEPDIREVFIKHHNNELYEFDSDPAQFIADLILACNERDRFVNVWKQLNQDSEENDIAVEAEAEQFFDVFVQGMNAVAYMAAKGG